MFKVAIICIVAAPILCMAIWATRVNQKKQHRLAYNEHVTTSKKRALERLDEAFENNNVVNTYRKLRILKEILPRQREYFLAARKKQSWWNKMTTPGFDDYEYKKSMREIDQSIQSIEPKYKIVRTAYEDKIVFVSRRCEMAKASYRQEFIKYKGKNFDSLMVVGLLSAAASIPISVTLDLNKAGDIYDSLRSVNGNYTELSNLDIWMQTLMMPEASLEGLTSLTKGAYFEQLVAEKYQGTLHENFNHPDTDITIDGIEYQIKATDSASYIETVDIDTPIIATTEIASATRALDSGINNFDLNSDVATALGGSIIDFSDVAMDAVFSGFGGVGVMAALSGARAATRKYGETGSLVLATGSGISTTSASVAKTTVNTAELTFKVGKFGVKNIVGGVKLAGKLRSK